jgi:hypothetical protein
LADLQEWCAWIEQMGNAISRQELASRYVFGLGSCSAPADKLGKSCAEIADQPTHDGLIGAELFGSKVDRGFQYGHLSFSGQRVSDISSRPINMRRISDVPAPIS